MNDADGAAGYTTNPTNKLFLVLYENGIWVYVCICTDIKPFKWTLTHEVGIG